jgi:hypothetical protein
MGRRSAYGKDTRLERYFKQFLHNRIRDFDVAVDVERYADVDLFTQWVEVRVKMSNYQIVRVNTDTGEVFADGDDYRHKFKFDHDDHEKMAEKIVTVMRMLIG